ncbi:nickel-responsive transcriptional regulator NikR [Paenibacillus apiarius]|uniref:Putative nickel-responsive regulator n=1 Tax=Paenibacillus apiarius TaxID=46240 RepID=A0ABT4DMF2_9BACL|nr:nickel-responsive transcriptional regulator NikR [Paenibacillus apiarius]MBN3522599.1 nickel-responsive transcriptional regulator NikR [Paenibacillus apiarius]MCY9514553.1 nickel-responsive transcriptional regulator NikR [Paenibacillus apiarius]MCY9518543.1 nickel-responsive transcriptional regulator NikR [Paenibacillus apiarius]MCY9552631.1 nickel-responsive transcriptional regulator NikR [Paenibacillus apiarius]MCY9557041.1 nickel-responsive transcriptional regulator NikR [Paenibacillus a
MNDSNLKRFGVSMDGKLLDKFDETIKGKGYENRSEAVRDLVRDALVKESLADDDKVVAGSILLFYNHHHRNLLDELARLQHEMHDLILATTHFHLDPSNCLELIVVKGKAKDLKVLSDQIISLKGVKYGKFTVAPIDEPHS